jgi:hypothetical protein
MDIAKLPSGHQPVTPRLSSFRNRRSKRATNPLRGLSLNSARGRYINDVAARLLATLPGYSDNTLAVNDCVALGELSWRASEMRRDPAANAEVLIKLEGLVDRRMRRLHLRYPGKGKPSLMVTDPQERER